jgi:beta-glucosidase-like glycosyl hydrolase
MRKKLVAVLTVLMLTAICGDIVAQRFDARGLTFRDPETNWIDSVMATLNLDQRIAQLMMVRVPLDMDDKQASVFSEVMNGYGVGGVCFFAGTADRQVSMTRRFQRDANVPLLVAIDGEWGLGMRLKDMYSFPRAARFGEVSADADSIVYRLGEEIGSQCREMGIHINFAPVADINSNPKNPVIGTRSFGTDPQRVAQLASLYARGQQSQGVMAVAKHFPGHGDTDKDSHLELPVINHSRAYMDTVDLVPFRRLFADSVGGVMIAHLQVNAYDSLRPSSLSPVIVNGLLKRTMGFDGLVITDGIDMKGITNSYRSGNAELMALLAGNDLILLPPNVQEAIEAIKTAAVKQDTVRRLIDYHCRRVLKAKYHYVRPYIHNDLRVPGEEHRYLCNDIVSDLNLNVDRRIDSIVGSAISQQAMPGCQIVVMHRGRVVIDRCYGNQTYDSTAAPVTPETLYDLASLTKVCATTLAVMKLVDNGKLSINDKLSRYLPYLKSTEKTNITVKQALSHCAGLKAFDALWQQTSLRDSIPLLVAKTPLTGNNDYLYSDFGFILLADMVERITGQTLDEFVADNFYDQMGFTSTMFNPLDNDIPADEIAPTELDSLRGLIRGTVHDPNAYAMDGVSGHAGLFSNAREVALIMQMLLNGGELDGHRYLKQKTVETFTRRHFDKQGNRRALGFDKQLFTPSTNAQVCPQASQASFGHTGFTGTMVWADPDYQLVYVFLSNRVHPSATPNRLAQLNVRTDIQTLLYNDLRQ